jgi:hypothetical protein
MEMCLKEMYQGDFSESTYFWRVRRQDWVKEEVKM